jgi:hypothetical protein
LFAGEVFGVWVNIVLALLVTAAFFLNFLELLFLILLAVFVFNWQPAPSPEMAIYAILPILVYWLHRFLPVKPWLGNLSAIFLSIFILYVVVGADFLIAAPIVFLADAFGSMVFGAIFFRICEAVCNM